MTIREPRLPEIKPGADTSERLRVAMLFMEEWSNWWSYALGVDDDAPMPKAEKEAAEKMAASLGERAARMVIDNRRFLASVPTEAATSPERELLDAYEGVLTEMRTYGKVIPQVGEWVKRLDVERDAAARAGVTAVQSPHATQSEKP